LAIVLGRDSMLLGENFLREISPSIAAQFKPWFALAPADPIPTSLSDPVCGLIMDMSLMVSENLLSLLSAYQPSSPP
jgi:hypothetical protein